ncbi:hypothetical protein BT69DRAFT_864230 [Atractiella rhizophila]|nr:hypothetical protein BT69DRAFT_864230 [Atractiella rhizophila]
MSLLSIIARRSSYLSAPFRIATARRKHHTKIYSLQKHFPLPLPLTRQANVLSDPTIVIDEKEETLQTSLMEEDIAQESYIRRWWNIFLEGTGFEFATEEESASVKAPLSRRRWWRAPIMQLKKSKLDQPRKRSSELDGPRYAFYRFIVVRYAELRDLNPGWTDKEVRKQIIVDWNVQFGKTWGPRGAIRPPQLRYGQALEKSGWAGSEREVTLKEVEETSGKGKGKMADLTHDHFFKYIVRRYKELKDANPQLQDFAIRKRMLKEWNQQNEGKPRSSISSVIVRFAQILEKVGWETRDRHEIMDNLRREWKQIKEPNPELDDDEFLKYVAQRYPKVQAENPQWRDDEIRARVLEDWAGVSGKNKGWLTPITVRYAQTLDKMGWENVDRGQIWREMEEKSEIISGGEAAPKSFHSHRITSLPIRDMFKTHVATRYQELQEMNPEWEEATIRQKVLEEWNAKGLGRKVSRLSQEMVLYTQAVERERVLGTGRTLFWKEFRKERDKAPFKAVQPRQSRKRMDLSGQLHSSALMWTALQQLWYDHVVSGYAKVEAENPQWTDDMIRAKVLSDWNEGEHGSQGGRQRLQLTPWEVFYSRRVNGSEYKDLRRREFKKVMGREWRQMQMARHRENGTDALKNDGPAERDAWFRHLASRYSQLQAENPEWTGEETRAEVLKEWNEGAHGMKTAKQRQRLSEWDVFFAQRLKESGFTNQGRRQFKKEIAAEWRSVHPNDVEAKVQRAAGRPAKDKDHHGDAQRDGIHDRFIKHLSDRYSQIQNEYPDWAESAKRDLLLKEWNDGENGIKAGMLKKRISDWQLFYAQNVEKPEYSSIPRRQRLKVLGEQWRALLLLTQAIRR